MLAHLFNWEISVLTNTIPELSKYALTNVNLFYEYNFFTTLPILKPCTIIENNTII